MARLVLILITTLVLSACVKFPYPQVTLKQAPSDDRASIWLIAGSLHSDVVVETKWLKEYSCHLPASIFTYKYACLGWGDLIAYTHRWGLEDVPNALFWPSESIVQVVAFNTEVVPTFPKNDVIRATVPASYGARLSNFLNHSFSYAEDSAESPVTLREAKWGYGYFIKSPYRYYLPRMCNQWVSTALMEAGIYTTKPSSLMSAQTLKNQMEKYNSLIHKPLPTR